MVLTVYMLPKRARDGTYKELTYCPAQNGSLYELTIIINLIVLKIHLWEYIQCFLITINGVYSLLKK